MDEYLVSYMQSGRVSLKYDETVSFDENIRSFVFSEPGEHVITATYREEADQFYISLVASMTVNVVEILPEPEHFTGTIAEAIADLNQENAYSKLYDLEGYVVAWQNGKSGPGEYGNYYLADSIDETDL